MSTDPRRFLYRPDGLDPDAALRLTADALKGCDDGELYLQYTASESFGFDDGRLKTADFNTQAGFGLRGVSGETTAFAQANELSEAAIRRAAETMAVLDPAKGAAPRRRRGGPTPRSTPTPIRSSLIPFARKVALCQQIDAAARARDPRVAQVSVALAGSWSGDRDRPRRRLRRPRRAAAGPPQRPDRRRAERPARDRLSRPRRPLSLRRAVRAGDLEPGDRHGARPGAGEPRIGRRARPAR